MVRILRPIVWAGTCVAVLVCASCFSMSLPKSARLEPGSPDSQGSGSSVSLRDKTLVDKWELLYQVNDKGGEERPRESTRTTIEFTGTGKVIFDRTDSESGDSKKIRSGQYTLANEEVSITDDAGNTVQWPYQVTGDTLVLVMPEVKKKFFWRRIK